MAFQILYLVAACVCITQVVAIELPTCPETNLTNFAVTLGTNLDCALAFRMANDTPTTDDGMNALDKICIAGCAGAIVQFLTVNCTDPLQAAGLTFWCQPADFGEIRRCRSALDIREEGLFTSMDIIACGSFNETCPANCEEGLEKLSEEIGCCFQNIYNSSAEVLSGLVSSQIITPVESTLIAVLSNSALWDACGVDIPQSCTSPIFPEEILITTTGSQVFFGCSLFTTIIFCLFALIF